MVAPTYHRNSFNDVLSFDILFQYLRSMLDMGGIYDNEKAGKWKVVKGMTVIGAMRNPCQGEFRVIRSSAFKFVNESRNRLSLGNF